MTTHLSLVSRDLWYDLLCSLYTLKLSQSFDFNSCASPVKHRRYANPMILQKGAFCPKVCVRFIPPTLSWPHHTVVWENKWDLPHFPWTFVNYTQRKPTVAEIALETSSGTLCCYYSQLSLRPRAISSTETIGLPELKHYYIFLMKKMKFLFSAAIWETMLVLIVKNKPITDIAVFLPYTVNYLQSFFFFFLHQTWTVTITHIQEVSYVLADRDMSNINSTTLLISRHAWE